MLNQLKILLIEDDLSWALLMKGFLSVSNKIELASTVKSAQKCIEAKSFDVFLLDKGLPDGDGLALIPIIKKAHPYSTLLVLTGDSDYQNVVQALELGADDYLVKSEQILPELMIRITIAKSNVERRFFYSLPENFSVLTARHFENFLNHSEAKYISRALALCQGDMAKTAQKLGISRATLFNKVNGLKIPRSAALSEKPLSMGEVQNA